MDQPGNNTTDGSGFAPDSASDGAAAWLLAYVPPAVSSCLEAAIRLAEARGPKPLHEFLTDEANLIIWVPCVLFLVAVLIWRWFVRHVIDTIAAVLHYKTRPKRESTVVNLFAANENSSNKKRSG